MVIKLNDTFYKNISQSPNLPFRKKFYRWVKRDFNNFIKAISPLSSAKQGLYTYHLSIPERQTRIHLRIEPNQTGTLFIDVSDVLHLNQTATKITKMLLDGIPPGLIHKKLSNTFSGIESEELNLEIQQIYAIINSVCTSENTCKFCDLQFLQRTPLFSTQTSAPYKADLAITYQCNNNCSHCYNEPERRALSSLSKKEWFQVIDKLAHIGIPHIIFTGGEPTLYPHLSELIHHANNNGQIVGLISNGRRLSDKIYLETLTSAGLNHIQITLESCYIETHNSITGAESFHQTIRGIENALQSPIHTITNTTIMRKNINHIDEIIEFVHNLGVKTFAMNSMIHSGCGFLNPDAISPEELSPLLVRIKESAKNLGIKFLWYTPTEYCRMSPIELDIGIKCCNAGQYSICIEPNGDVLPCQSFYKSVGNFLNDPWEKIWNSELFLKFRHRRENPQKSGLHKKCWDCSELMICGGGCPLEHKAQKGQLLCL